MSRPAGCRSWQARCSARFAMTSVAGVRIGCMFFFFKGGPQLGKKEPHHQKASPKKQTHTSICIGFGGPEGNLMVGIWVFFFFHGPAIFKMSFRFGTLCIPPKKDTFQKTRTCSRYIQFQGYEELMNQVKCVLVLYFPSFFLQNKNICEME